MTEKKSISLLSTAPRKTKKPTEITRKNVKGVCMYFKYFCFFYGEFFLHNECNKILVQILPINNLLYFITKL